MFLLALLEEAGKVDRVLVFFFSILLSLRESPPGASFCEEKRTAGLPGFVFGFWFWLCGVVFFLFRFLGGGEWGMHGTRPFTRRSVLPARRHT